MLGLVISWFIVILMNPWNPLITRRALPASFAQNQCSTVSSSHQTLFHLQKERYLEYKDTVLPFLKWIQMQWSIPLHFDAVSCKSFCTFAFPTAVLKWRRTGLIHGITLKKKKIKNFSSPWTVASISRIKRYARTLRQEDLILCSQVRGRGCLLKSNLFCLLQCVIYHALDHHHPHN